MAQPERTDSAGAARSVGIVGAGQLARMLIEAASALGIRCVVLAADPGDAAAMSAHEVVIGSPADEAALAELAARCEVVTFDHELVDLDLLRQMEAAGTVVRPSPEALLVAVDKAAQRRRFSAAGMRVPRFVVLDSDPTSDEATMRSFASDVGSVPVVKAASGGYDGRGVVVAERLEDAVAASAAWRARGVEVVVEERVGFARELAALVARRPSGELCAWRTVETAQEAGVCREVLVPGELDERTADAASSIARQIAEEIGLVGVMAVELFEADAGLVVNEVALRPHNSGHWTIEGAVTSQFENHLRAVLDLPLGSTELTAPSIATVNVFGAEGDSSLTELASALADPRAKVHLYGKQPRPGRKLGHVTVVGTDPEADRERAWRAACALGTTRLADQAVSP